MGIPNKIYNAGQMTQRYELPGAETGIVLFDNMKVSLEGPIEKKTITLVASGLARPQGLMNGREHTDVLVLSGKSIIGRATVLQYPSSPGDRPIKPVKHRVVLKKPFHEVDGVSLDTVG